MSQFRSQNPETWFTEGKNGGLRDRRRNLRPGQPAPSTRPIGQIKVEGFRCWVWRDDGSVWDIDNDFPAYDLYWMIAYGNRRSKDRSDLQDKRQNILHDPVDAWRPDEADYEDLLESADDGFSDRVVAAVREAAQAAEAHPNTVVAIQSEEFPGQVIHEHDADTDIDGVIVAEFHERWVLLKKKRPSGRPLIYNDARNLALFAYPESIVPRDVFTRYTIRDLLVADPNAHWVFYAELDD